MIRLHDVSVRAGRFALAGVGFEVQAGDYAVLMGRTGSGKTTLLEAICGLRKISAGSIHLLDRDVTKLPPGQRGVGYVPQDRALFQTMTVREHLAFALVIRQLARETVDQRVAELSSLLGLAHLLDRKPHGLSGGEAQRVALGRALSARPGILCLDEPLSALDDETRGEMCELLEKVRRTSGVTTLHVTHNLSEAERLGGRILRLRDGRVEQER